jgi:hypothetical protein
MVLEALAGRKEAREQPMVLEALAARKEAKTLRSRFVVSWRSPLDTALEVRTTSTDHDEHGRPRAMTHLARVDAPRERGVDLLDNATFHWAVA